MSQFVCLKCGSNELIFTKWVKSEERVIVHDDGFREYHQLEIDENDVLGVEYGFICGQCKQPIGLHGEYITTEAELTDYLNLTSQLSAEEEIFSVDPEN